MAPESEAYDGVLPDTGNTGVTVAVISVLDLLCFVGYVILSGSPASLIALAVVYGIRIVRE